MKVSETHKTHTRNTRICVIVEPKAEKGALDKSSIIRLLNKTFPKLIKNIKLQVQEILLKPNSINT